MNIYNEKNLNSDFASMIYNYTRNFIETSPTVAQTAHGANGREVRRKLRRSIDKGSTKIMNMFNYINHQLLMIESY